MSLCISVGGKIAVTAASIFTLSWTHSVEKVRWEEEWRVTPAGLEVLSARVKGSGAGMEPPQGAVLDDGWWRYRPVLPPRPELVLAASGATGAGWTLCADDQCTVLGADPGSPVVISSCEMPSPK